MRIVIDARYLSSHPSGIGTYSECLLKHLSRIDQENKYTVLVRPSYNSVLELGVNFRLLEYDAPPLSLKTVFGLHKLLNRLKPDIFHSFFPVTPVFYRGKMVVTVHDLQPLQMKEWTGGRPWPIQMGYDFFYRWMYGGTFRRATALITVSKATQDALSRLYPEVASKISAVLSGLPKDAQETTAPETFEQLKREHRLDGEYVLFIGSTRPNKNIPNMLRAFATLRHNRSASVSPANHNYNSRSESLLFVLVLSKDRFFQSVEQVIREENLEGAVRILSSVSEEDKRTLYRNAQTFFFATRFEGFGFPVLEAQAQGTPVVASDCESLPEILRDSALLVNPDDIESMSRALARVLEDEALRRKLIENGKENIARFSWEKAAQEVLGIYRRLGPQ